VRSFDLTGPGDAGLVAQIIVCADVAVRESRRGGHSAQRELLLYAVHGLLHLTGYDDTTPPKAARMRARQEELLDAYLVACRRR
jgi:probable rRNA maturation factor